MSPITDSSTQPLPVSSIAVAEMVGFLSSSVKCASLSGHEDRVSGLYRDFFLSRGWDVDTQPLSEAGATTRGRGVSEERTDARFNVLGWYRKRRGLPVVVINGHMDVVPVHDEAHWNRPPFCGDITEDGHVYGRGSVDTKGGISAALFALDALDRAGYDFPFDILVELVVGEETTGIGTQASLEYCSKRLGTIVLEPTDNAVVPLASGVLFFSVTVSGRAAHTSVPWHGVDAGSRVVRIYEALMRLGAARAQTHTHRQIPLPSAVPLAIGTLRAGGFRASVPAEGFLSGRVGVLPGEDLQTVREAFAACIRKADVGEFARTHPAELRWDHDGSPSWETPADADVVEMMTEGRRRTGLPERIEGITSGCDAGILVAENIPTVVFGPGHMRLAHSPDEMIPRTDVATAATILANCLIAWSRRHESR